MVDALDLGSSGVSRESSSLSRSTNIFREEIAMVNTELNAGVLSAGSLDTDGHWSTLPEASLTFAERPENQAGFSKEGMRVLKENFPDKKLKGYYNIHWNAGGGSTLRYTAHMAVVEDDHGEHLVKVFTGFGGPHNAKMPDDSQLDGIVFNGLFEAMNAVGEFVNEHLAPQVTESAKVA